jgi:opacity protein-like surface antigen
MIRFRRCTALLLGLAAGAVAVTPLRAEDTKGKWQFGLGLSYMATTDYIRSNSDIAIAPTIAGDDPTGIPPVTAVDERPDENMLNEPTVADDFRLDFNASYGLTRWLALELAAGYMKSDVGNIEFYFKDVTINYGGTFPASGSAVCGPTRNSPCSRYNINTPSAPPTNSFVPVGTLTEVPLQLSALVRFRPESPLDPYVGLGIGYLLTSLEQGEEFVRRGEGIAELQVASEHAGEFTNTGAAPKRVAGLSGPFSVSAMQAEVSSDFSWHAVGGVDYFVNDHFSVYVDARYTWTDAAVSITTDGAHQVLLTTFAPGKLQTMRIDTPNEWEDNGIFGQSTGDHLIATEDSNGNGTMDILAGEDDGILYLYPSGPNPNDPDCADTSSVACQWTAADAIQVIDCRNDTICPWRGNANDLNMDLDYQDAGEGFDREDLNGNRILDRFMYYGVDICSGIGPGQTANPICTPSDILAAQQFVWPGNGCNTVQPEATNGSFFPEGCPAVPTAASDVSLAGSDDPADTYLIQGGEIKLGGFSLGVGFKFTF